MKSPLPKLPWWGWALGLGAAAAIGASGSAEGSAAPSGRPDDPKRPPLPSGPPPLLKLGSSGPWVAALQGLLGLAPTGNFDEALDRAVRDYQRSKSIGVDGAVGPQTWGQLGVGASGGQPKPQAAPQGGGAGPTAPEYSGGAKVPIGAPGPSKPTSSVDWASVAANANDVSAEALKAPPGGGESGRSWVMALTSNTEAREQQCIAAVEAGFLYPVPWVPVSWNQDGHAVTIWAAADAVLVGKADPIRITVSHLAAQIMADRLNAMLPTSKMSNATWLACPNKLPPSIMNSTWASVKAEHKGPPATAYLLDMSNNDTVCEHSDRVSKARQAQGLAPYASFASPNGKDWVSSERLLAGGAPAAPSSSTIGHGGAGVAGANFGWQSPSGLATVALGGVKVYQSIGLAHDWHHHDYSQTLTVYKRDCVLDGASRSVEEVLRDPALAYLLSDEVLKGTPCRVWRHPAVAPGT